MFHFFASCTTSLFLPLGLPSYNHCWGLFEVKANQIWVLYCLESQGPMDTRTQNVRRTQHKDLRSASVLSMLDFVPFVDFYLEAVLCFFKSHWAKEAPPGGSQGYPCAALAPPSIWTWGYIYDPCPRTWAGTVGLATSQSD